MKIYGDIGYLQDNYGRYTEIEPITELEPPDGLNIYRKMRMNDPIIAGLVSRIEFVIRKASWGFQGRQGSKGSDVEKLSAVFDLHRFIEEAVSAITYGFYVGEICWDSKGNIDVIPRAQPSIQGINAEGVWQLNVQKPIPIKKCAHWVPITESRSPFGISLLRGAYKPYYYKRSVEASEAVGIDRDISGLPIMNAPEGFDFNATDEGSINYSDDVKETLDWAIEIVSKVRKDQQQGVVLPFGWTLELLQSKRGSTIDTSRIITRYNVEIISALMQGFVAVGLLTSGGGTAAGVSFASFKESCNAIADSLQNCFNSQVLPVFATILRLKNPPMLTHGRITGFELKDIASYVSRLASQGVMTPTSELETALLGIADLPKGTDVKQVVEK